MSRSKVHPSLVPDLTRQDLLVKYLDDLNFLIAQNLPHNDLLVQEKIEALEEYVEVCERLYILREQIINKKTFIERVLERLGR